MSAKYQNHEDFLVTIVTAAVNRAAVELAEETLLNPPRHERIRPELRGETVARFWLPRELCPPRNQLQEEHFGTRERRRKRVLGELRKQFLQLGLGRRKLPLDGFPQVLEVRFSSQPVDDDCGFAKQAVDCLCPSRHTTTKRGTKKLVQGLGLIAGDSPLVVERHSWWEYAPPRLGVVMVEVRR